MDADQSKWLRTTIKSWLARWDVQLGYTNLESEVGLLFGDVLMQAAIPYRLILPDLATLTPNLSNADFQRVLGQANATYHLEPNPMANPWSVSRRQAIEYCDVVFAVLCGTKSIDQEIQAAQMKACLAQRAVISINLVDRSSKVICKHDQW